MSESCDHSQSEENQLLYDHFMEEQKKVLLNINNAPLLSEQEKMTLLIRFATLLVELVLVSLEDDSREDFMAEFSNYVLETFKLKKQLINEI